jgi:hypothetical protein
VASFFGVEPPRVDGYADRVRTRAAEIREGVADRGIDDA